MEYKNMTKLLERQNFFKNIALKATDFCLKDFDSNEISEDEEKCLKKASINLYAILERNKFEQHVIIGAPAHPW